MIRLSVSIPDWMSGMKSARVIPPYEPGALEAGDLIQGLDTPPSLKSIRKDRAYVFCERIAFMFATRVRVSSALSSIASNILIDSLAHS